MLHIIKSVLADESGQGLTEYALILALVAVAAVGVLTTLGQNVNAEISKASQDV